MRRLGFVLLTLALTVVVHLDWHLGRPASLPYGFGWSQHWMFAAASFAAVGWAIGRLWPERTARAAAWIVGLALIVAQVIEPAFEAWAVEGRLGLLIDANRWTSFGVCVAVGIPALAVAARLARGGRRQAIV